MNILIADDSYEAVRLADELINCGHHVVTRACETNLLRETIKIDRPEVIVSCSNSNELFKLKSLNIPILTIKNYNLKQLKAELKKTSKQHRQRLPQRKSKRKDKGARRSRKS